MEQIEIQSAKKAWTDPEVVLLSINDSNMTSVGINDDWEL